MQHKKGGAYYHIPYEIDFQYGTPQTDHARHEHQVARLLKDEARPECLETLEEAVSVYMDVYRSKFSPLSVQRRDLELKRFLRYLKSNKHSMKLLDLSYADGENFLRALVNAYDGSELSREQKKDYRSALRSLSRFLTGCGILQEDIFFDLTVE